VLQYPARRYEALAYHKRGRCAICVALLLFICSFVPLFLASLLLLLLPPPPLLPLPPPLFLCVVRVVCKRKVEKPKYCKQTRAAPDLDVSLFPIRRQVWMHACASQALLLFQWFYLFIFTCIGKEKCNYIYTLLLFMEKKGNI
jgi:uncharacterized membrane protein YfcA